MAILAWICDDRLFSAHLAACGCFCNRLNRNSACRLYIVLFRALCAHPIEAHGYSDREWAFFSAWYFVLWKHFRDPILSRLARWTALSVHFSCGLTNPCSSFQPHMNDFHVHFQLSFKLMHINQNGNGFSLQKIINTCCRYFHLNSNRLVKWKSFSFCSSLL